MATYKLIQDIEAEDHILGPLTLRQFIYGLIAAFFLYLSFISIAKHFPFALIIFLPPALFMGFLAFPFGKDQPTEVWALAKIRFFFKPRRRIWNQSGVKELVTITVPKKLEVQLTDGLSQKEVKSRLQALADTIDTRGWAIKNVTQQSNNFVQYSPVNDQSERLISLASMPQPVPDYVVPADADMLDEQGTSQLAQQFTTMINASTQQHRKQLMDQLAGVRATQQTAQPQWFASSPLAGPQPVAAQPASNDDQALVNELEDHLAAQAQANAHLRTVPVTPASEVATTIEQTTPPAPVKPVTPQPDPAILNLAKNDDLDIATLARQAHKRSGPSEGEVVIDLH